MVPDLSVKGFWEIKLTVTLVFGVIRSGAALEKKKEKKRKVMIHLSRRNYCDRAADTGEYKQKVLNQNQQSVRHGDRCERKQARGGGGSNEEVKSS